jgi:hypothetical protein
MLSSRKVRALGALIFGRKSSLLAFQTQATLSARSETFAAKELAAAL